MGAVSLAAGVPGGDYIAKPFEAMWRAVLPWVATRVFGVTGAAATFIENNGSGDTTLNYVQVFCWRVFSVIVAAVWAALDRRRPNYRVPYDWLYLIVRYTLALTMLSYGLAKVIRVQMSAPGPVRLIEPWVSSRPWACSGHFDSPPDHGGILVFPSVRALAGLLFLNPDATPPRLPGPHLTRWQRAGAICLAVGMSGYLIYSSMKEVT
jgi:hypothetical protein